MARFAHLSHSITNVIEWQVTFLTCAQTSIKGLNMSSGALFGRRLYAALIGPEVTDATIANLVDSCRVHEAYILGVVVNLHQIRLAAALLKDTDVAVIGAIAYPLGNLPTELKEVHIQQAIEDGARGIAAVMKMEALRAGNYAEAREDATSVAAVCRRSRIAGPQADLSIGFIANSASLSSVQVQQAARIALDEGAAYVTNTGFGVESKPEHVRAIRESMGNDLRIIAAGGCRTAEQAIEYVTAGADAIGTSTAFQIIEQLEALKMLRDAA